MFAIGTVSARFRSWAFVALAMLAGPGCGGLHAVYGGDGDADADADQVVPPTPTGMIVLGGWSTTSPALSDGAVYDPATDSWSTWPGLSAGPIGGRAHHSAVWTGTSLIVWGGSSSTTMMNDGAIYSPEADAWSTPAGLRDGPLTPRRNHAALWTGSSMIVWGGYSGGSEGDRADGAIYSAADDSWSSPPGLNSSPLAGRRSAAVVWTGDVMLLWGGTAYVDATGEWATYSDGAMYDPITDSWSQPPGLSSDPARPTARYTAAAAWTGSQMILWGGWDTHSAGDGGIYHPASDSWSRPAGLGVGASPLAARSYAQAAWTGSDLILWGGNDEGLLFGNGAVYEPATDNWRSPPGLGAGPSLGPRRGHSATWAF